MNVNSDKSGDSSNSMNVNSDKSGDSSNSNDDSGLSNELSNMNIDTSSSSSSKKKKKNTCLFCLKEVEGLLGCSDILSGN